MPVNLNIPHEWFVGLFPEALYFLSHTPLWYVCDAAFSTCSVEDHSLPLCSRVKESLRAKYKWVLVPGTQQVRELSYASLNPAHAGIRPGWVRFPGWI